MLLPVRLSRSSITVAGEREVKDFLNIAPVFD